jgi:hypothetical protein
VDFVLDGSIRDWGCGEVLWESGEWVGFCLVVWLWKSGVVSGGVGNVDENCGRTCWGYEKLMLKGVDRVGFWLFLDLVVVCLMMIL